VSEQQGTCCSDTFLIFADEGSQAETS